MELTQGLPDAKVTLREITRDSLRVILDLKVSKEQEQFVASNAVSIAEAHFSDEHSPWFRAIYADKTPVGFVMLGEMPEKGLHFLWRLMVDEKYQGRDYGRKALELVIQHIKTMTSTKELLTSCHDGKGSPKGFYLKMGFVETGEKLDNGEIVMKLKF